MNTTQDKQETAVASQNCECNSTFVDPRCKQHGAHEYHGAPQTPTDEQLANQLLRDLADGKGWDETRWAKRGITKAQYEAAKAPAPETRKDHSTKAQWEKLANEAISDAGEWKGKFQDERAHAERLATALRAALSCEYGADWQDALVDIRKALAAWKGAQSNE